MASIRIHQGTYYEQGLPGGVPPVAAAGAVMTYTYNTLGQPVRMQQGAADVVSTAEYNAAGQMTQMVYNQTTTETRTYNERLQLSGISWTGGQSVQYEYWTAANHSDNNGQVRKTIAASSTKPWSETYTYDGFGNRTGAGVPITAANNRVAYTYDDNGNVTVMPQMTLEYDVDNRLVRATHQTSGLDEYVYDPGGQRVMKNGVITLYGIDGTRLGMYTLGMIGSIDPVLAFRSIDYLGLNAPQYKWFAGRPGALHPMGPR